jgi:CRP-like cAMP-binding protein
MLSSADLALLMPMDRVELSLRQDLETANAITEFVYFIEDGLASVVAQSGSSKAVEVGIVGPEGMTGHGIVYGDQQSPFATFIQSAGAGWRIEADRLRSALDSSASLRGTVLLYARAFSIQVATTAFANGNSKLEERLSRWLLMVQDRVGNTLHITHEFLSIMLAVRRSGVTVGLQVLEGRGLIRAQRGAIIITDRKGLIEASNRSYGLAEAEYDRLLGFQVKVPADAESL